MAKTTPRVQIAIMNEALDHNSDHVVGTMRRPIHPKSRGSRGQITRVR